MNLQETARLEELLKTVKSKHFRDFCSALLSNQIGGAGSSLHVNPDVSAQRQALLELLVHLDSLLLSGTPLLVLLYHIAFQPQNVTVRHFLPRTYRGTPVVLQMKFCSLVEIATQPGKTVVQCLLWLWKRKYEYVSLETTSF